MWQAQGLLLGIVFAGLSLAGVTIRYLLRRLALFLPLLLVFGLSIPAARTNALAWNWTISLWLRCVISFLAGLWLIHVLPFPELLSTLQRWRCPRVLIAMLGFMYRYTFILWDELRLLRNARQAREFGGIPRWRSWAGNSQTLGLLLLRAMERAERTHRAMLARGWDGSIRFLNVDGE
jgi:cobalt/nickel transport system permease protein